MRKYYKKFDKNKKVKFTKKAKNEGKSWFKNGIENSYLYDSLGHRIGCKHRKSGRIIGYTPFTNPAKYRMQKARYHRQSYKNMGDRDYCYDCGRYLSYGEKPYHNANHTIGRL